MSTAFVNGGSIDILGSLPYSAKRDALRWILYGQVKADQKFNRNDSPDDWNKEFLRVLDKVGLKVYGRLPQQSVTASSIGASVDEVVLNLLNKNPFLTEVGQLILPITIGALNNLANSDALSTFNKFASKASDANIHNSCASKFSSANIQVLDGSIDDDNNVSINISYLDFTSNEVIDNLLFWKWTDGSFSLNYGWLSLNLAGTNADKFRTLIANEIGQLVNDDIIPIDLS